MTNLIEFERKLIDAGQEYTTFKQCSLNKKDDGTDFFVSNNEVITVFNLDDIKENLLVDQYPLPMSVDSMWIDHANNSLHLIEFKDVPDLRGTKRKDIRLKLLDTVLFLNKDFNVNSFSGVDVIFVLVRTLSPKELITYHVKSKAKDYTPAYLKYIRELGGFKVLELKPDDFDHYIKNRSRFVGNQ